MCEWVDEWVGGGTDMNRDMTEWVDGWVDEWINWGNNKQYVGFYTKERPCTRRY